MFDLSKQKIDIDCPSCSKKIKLTLEEVSEQATVICPSCSQSLKLHDNGDSKYSILIIECQLSDEEQCEINCLVSQCGLLGFNVEKVVVSKTKDLLQHLEKGNKYNLIYLSAHGNKKEFLSENSDFKMEWKDFAHQLCISKNMEEDCVVMLSCCRGGLNEVSYILFYYCAAIQFVIGAPQKLDNYEFNTAFSIFLFNYEIRGYDPIIAAKKVEHGIGTRLIGFDRTETEATIGYSNYIETRIENPPLEDQNHLSYSRISLEEDCPPEGCCPN